MWVIDRQLKGEKRGILEGKKRDASIALFHRHSIHSFSFLTHFLSSPASAPLLPDWFTISRPYPSWMWSSIKKIDQREQKRTKKKSTLCSAQERKESLEPKSRMLLPFAYNIFPLRSAGSSSSFTSFTLKIKWRENTKSQSRRVIQQQQSVWILRSIQHQSRSGWRVDRNRVKKESVADTSEARDDDDADRHHHHDDDHAVHSDQQEILEICNSVLFSSPPLFPMLFPPSSLWFEFRSFNMPVNHDAWTAHSLHVCFLWVCMSVAWLKPESFSLSLQLEPLVLSNRRNACRDKHTPFFLLPFFPIQSLNHFFTKVLIRMLNHLSDHLSGCRKDERS